MTLCGGWTTCPHQRLERSPVEGLAFEGGHFGRHGYGLLLLLLPLGGLESVLRRGDGEAPANDTRRWGMQASIKIWRPQTRQTRRTRRTRRAIGAQRFRERAHAYSLLRCKEGEGRRNEILVQYILQMDAGSTRWTLCCPPALTTSGAKPQSRKKTNHRRVPAKKFGTPATANNTAKPRCIPAVWT